MDKQRLTRTSKQPSNSPLTTSRIGNPSPKGILRNTSSSPSLRSAKKEVKITVCGQHTTREKQENVLSDGLKRRPIPVHFRKLLALTKGQSTSLKSIRPKTTVQPRTPLETNPQSAEHRRTPDTSVERRTRGGDTGLESETELLELITRQLGLPTDQYRLVPTSSPPGNVPTSLVIPNSEGYQIYTLRH